VVYGYVRNDNNAGIDDPVSVSTGGTVSGYGYKLFAITDAQAGDKTLHPTLSVGTGDAWTAFLPLKKAGLVNAAGAGNEDTSADWGLRGKVTLREYGSYQWKANDGTTSKSTVSLDIDRYHGNAGSNFTGFTSTAGIIVSGTTTKGSNDDATIRNALNTWGLIEVKAVLNKPFGQDVVGHPWVLQSGLNTALPNHHGSTTNGAMLVAFGAPSPLPGTDAGDGTTSVTLDL
jgi:hypothetical protein